MGKLVLFVCETDSSSGPQLEADDGMFIYTKDRSITGVGIYGKGIHYTFQRAANRLYTMECPLVTENQWEDAARRLGKTVRKEGSDLIACATAVGVAAVHAIQAATVATMASVKVTKSIAEVSQLVHEGDVGTLGFPTKS